MPSHLADRWNNAVCFVAMAYGQQRLSTGSGFFWRHGQKLFLVSNWHNFSGRNALTGDPMSPTGGIPDRVVLMTFKRTSEEDEQGFFEISYIPIEVALCNSALEESTWVEHATWGRRADVAALDVTAQTSGTQAIGVNELESDAVVDPIVAQDAFVVGYPFGMISGAPAPIWKRGTIALDPNFDPEGLPKLLIDTATREGMSGSVVISRHTIVGKPVRRKNGDMSKPFLFAQIDRVAGIYSGRHYPDLEKAQLGIVWKRQTIEETVSSGTPPR